MAKSRHYGEEFKREAIMLVKTSSKTMSAIAEDLGLAPGTLSVWIKKGIDGEDTASEVKEIQTLRRELAETRLERDILKKAMAIFSRQQ